MKVLLIEPDAVLAATYKACLLADGHQVVVAPTAQSAIFAADEQLPDLVVLELQLVSHSGIEFLYEFRSYSEWQRVPVVIHSVVPPGEFIGSKELLYDGLGVMAYHYKPHTSLIDLRRVVRRYVNVVA